MVKIRKKCHEFDDVLYVFNEILLKMAIMLFLHKSIISPFLVLGSNTQKFMVKGQFCDADAILIFI